MKNTAQTCPICGEARPQGWLVCVGCAYDTPPRLYLAWQGARGIAHARVANEYPPAEIARCQQLEKEAADRILSHLKQNGSALSFA